MRRLVIPILILMTSAQSLGDERPPLLSYKKMQELKVDLVDHLWEVEVLPKPDHPNMDPETVPRRYGQGVPLKVPDQGVRILVSGDLVKGWSRIALRASRNRRCTPEEVRVLKDLDVALILCKEPLDGTSPVPLASDELGVEGALVFSIDNPAGNMPSMYYGFLAGPAEAPLAEFHYTNVGGVMSYPLLSHKGELIGLTLRRLRPQPDTLSIAVTCRQLRARMTIRRRQPEGPNRLRDTARRPFHYE